jgi:NCS1 family nucleobase:cation symporter-1
MSLWKAGAFGCSSAMVPMTCSPRHVVHPSAGENVVNNPDANLINDDIRPTSDAERHWSVFNMASLWVGMVVCVPTYTLAGGLVAEGMSAWQAIFTITLGNAIVLVPMVLNGHPGTKYGIPFPVLARASFGIHGAHIPSILRALVACGWFGINTWFGGVSIYHLMNVLTGGLLEGADLPFLGINAGEFSCFLLFWTIQVAVVYAGIESIRILETYAAPFLIAMGLALLAWAYVQAGGFGETFSRPSEFAVGGPKEGQFFSVFFPSLTAMVGFWATLSLNIPDFTRYAKSQRDQLLGQAIGLPLTMTLFAFIAVAVTGATFTIFGETIADPTKLLGRMGEESTGLMSGVTVVISLFVLAVATLSTNIAANLVSPANAFINVKPKLVGFQLGGYITAAIGLVIRRGSYSRIQVTTCLCGSLATRHCSGPLAAFSSSTISCCGRPSSTSKPCIRHEASTFTRADSTSLRSWRSSSAPPPIFPAFCTPRVLWEMVLFRCSSTRSIPTPGSSALALPAPSTGSRPRS